MKIWLADLTYTQQTIASDVVPAAVGLIGEFVIANLGEKVDVRLFKFPEALAEALAEDVPDILGMSNYVWNARLSSAFMRRVKEVHPRVVTVMGGPNFRTVPDEQERVLTRHPWIDYYILKEGEVAFLKLIEALIHSAPDLPVGLDVPNLLRLDADGKLIQPRQIERLMDLTAVPSPYLTGRLDEFLDGRLLPVIQTNRGCPFTCTFCTEGQAYWNKVRRKDADTISSEIRYISDKMAALPAERRRWDLLIADSNFAMFEEDLDVCRVLAGEQSSHGYPRYINVATGKNRKERVLEAARLVNGAMKLAGSVQSLDPTVQENIKRKNISADQIVEMALKAAEIGTNTYSEVILGLPGDSLQTHFKTLETLIESGFNTLSMYQLMVLPGTELGLDTTKQQYGMVCRYRALPRCFGVYEVLGASLRVAEIEEICITTNTLPYEDYLLCRRMNFIVNVFYNDGVFAELIKLLTMAGLSRWKWLTEIVSTPRHSADFDLMTHQFVRETEEELWEDPDQLEAFIEEPGVIERFVAGELGNNLIFRFKAISMTSRFPALCEVALGSIRSYLAAAAPDRPELGDLAEDIVNFKRMQIEGLFDDARPRRHHFRYDVARFAAMAPGEALDPAALRLESPVVLEFDNTPEQRRMIDSYTSLFGTDIRGLSRILSRVFLKQFLRAPAVPVVDQHIPTGSKEAL
jgi:radical SAM superfamily enzyme YgiQ (UPF0313 family)